MEQTRKPTSKTKVALMWLILVGNIVFWLFFWLWWNRGRSTGTEPGPDVVRSIFLMVIGGFFLVAGIVAYLAVIFLNCFTFNFTVPVWSGLKTRIYLANIFVPLLPALGFGLALSVFLTPALTALGLEAGLANLVPVFIMVGLLQIVQLWLLIWAPLERRVIVKRLLAQSITPAQLETAVLIGISNPARSSFKKFGAIEEDIGALWIGSDQLVYWGDTERFSISRDHLTQIERKGDTGSTTMLVGIQHVILHVKLPDGNERQVRLHTEGVWTMGQKRRNMDEMAESISRWHAAPASPQ